jgi:hypothetical protein
VVSDERGGTYDPELLRTPAKRVTRKSAFLLKLEREQEKARQPVELNDLRMSKVTELNKRRRS